MSTQPSQRSVFQPDPPQGLKYLPDFISAEEADNLVRKIDTQPWCDDLKRRVQHYGFRYDYKARQARAEDYLGPLPSFLQGLAEQMTHAGHFGFVPDQAIVNEYMPGGGIEPPTRGFSNRSFLKFFNDLFSENLSNPPRRIKHLAANCQTLARRPSNELAGGECVRGTKVRKCDTQADHHVLGGQGV